MPAASPTAIPLESLARRIYLIRGQKVMLDSDLAEIYQVPTSRLNEAVKRNNSRFPADFMFQLTAEEYSSLISQIAISNPGRGGRRKLPYAFTEHGVAMLSSVLHNERAIAVNILIIRAFIQLRELLATHKDLAARLDSLESHQRRHASVINLLASEIEQLKTPPSLPRPRPNTPSASPVPNAVNRHRLPPPRNPTLP